MQSAIQQNGISLYGAVDIGFNFQSVGGTSRWQTQATEVRTANRRLARDVRRAFRRAKNQGLRASNVTVRANNGAVTLTGSVPSADQVDLATNVAQGVPGVASVTSRVTVRKELSPRGSN